MALPTAAGWLVLSSFLKKKMARSGSFCSKNSHAGENM